MCNKSATNCRTLKIKAPLYCQTSNTARTPSLDKLLHCHIKILNKYRNQSSLVVSDQSNHQSRSCSKARGETDLPFTNIKDFSGIMVVLWKVHSICKIFEEYIFKAQRKISPIKKNKIKIQKLYFYSE